MLLVAGLLFAVHGGVDAREAPLLVDSAAEVSPILVGTPVPDGTLATQEGRKTTLEDQRGGQPAVLVFYRGHW
jgi:hypothetical protein